MDSRSEELERFKRIDLVNYASTRGYVIDSRASSRTSTLMRHTNGDKIGIGKSLDGSFVFYNYKGVESGTIIDLVQALDGGSLGDVRKTLRAYDGSAASRVPSPALPFKLQPSQHDASRVLAGWMKTRAIPASGHPYLSVHRGISVEVQTDPAFKGRIHIDARGNAVFPHYNKSGLCGYELKNGNETGTTFTGFSPGGVKGLACSRPNDDDREMIICETAIDMLSVATLHGINGRRFFSTSGQISSMQAECLRHAAERMPAGSRVLLSFDNDDAGRKLALQVRDELAECGLPIIDHFPPIPDGDWNDALQQTRRHDEPQMRTGDASFHP